MSAHCNCAHGCSRAPRVNGVCLACLGGWHSDICPEFTPPTPVPVNGRLRGLPLTLTDCGRCGFEFADHRRPSLRSKA